MTDRLPTKLGKEPLIDALFEVRFSTPIPASNVLPGFLFSKLPNCGDIERLSAAELPKPMRDADPNLQFAPLLKLHWNKFFISIGDRSLVVSCKMPYPGWEEFKSAILQIVECVMDSGIIQTIHRFSMKYIDLVPASNTREEISLINTSVVIGGHTLKEESFSLRIEVPQDGFSHVVQVVSSATAKLADGSVKSGIIVDIDTITPVDNQEFKEWSSGLTDKLDLIHTANKKMFFECLRPETITSLEPEYE